MTNWPINSAYIGLGIAMFYVTIIAISLGLLALNGFRLP